jgi:hypothetical protein
MSSWSGAGHPPGVTRIDERIMSKQIDRLVKDNPHKFQGWHTEIDGYGELRNEHLPSYWIFCAEEYFCPEKEIGVIHVKTVKEAVRLMRQVRKIV